MRNGKALGVGFGVGVLGGDEGQGGGIVKGTVAYACESGGEGDRHEAGVIRKGEPADVGDGLGEGHGPHRRASEGIVLDAGHGEIPDVGGNRHVEATAYV